jgi:AcrR family transcriptional regulator
VARTRSRDLENALVDAAEAVLVNDGPAGFTVRAVAAQAGVAPMGVYNRFGGRKGLAEAVLGRGFTGLRLAVASVVETDPLLRLQGAGLRYRDFALSHPQHYAAMFADSLGCGLGSPLLGPVAAAAFDELVTHVQYVIDSGAAPPTDAIDLTQQIWSAVHGAVSLELAGLVRTPNPEATYEHLLQLVLRGVTNSAVPTPDLRPVSRSRNRATTQ